MNGPARATRGLSLLLAWVVLDEFTGLVKELPQYRQHLRHDVDPIRAFVQGGLGSTANAVEQITAEIQRAAPAKADAAATLGRFRAGTRPSAKAIA